MRLLEFLNTRFSQLLSSDESFPVKLHEQQFKKGSVLTDYGQVERKVYFINNGLVQLAILHEGEERIIEFFSENNFVSSYTSFLRQEPSDCRLTALVNCEMEVLYHDELVKAYETSLLANKIGRIFTEKIYSLKTQREKDFLTKSAAERYADLIASRPDILKVVPVKKIAQYLGLHPESLSRIRKSIS
jgi:CRP-like cAMP-binding protein